MVGKCGTKSDNAVMLTCSAKLSLSLLSTLMVDHYLPIILSHLVEPFLDKGNKRVTTSWSFREGWITLHSTVAWASDVSQNLSQNNDDSDP